MEQHNIMTDYIPSSIQNSYDTTWETHGLSPCSDTNINYALLMADICRHETNIKEGIERRTKYVTEE